MGKSSRSTGKGGSAPIPAGCPTGKTGRPAQQQPELGCGKEARKGLLCTEAGCPPISPVFDPSGRSGPTVRRHGVVVEGEQPTEHDPTRPPVAEQWPSDPPPTDQQHAVLAWLALDADVPARVGVLLVDALRAWAPLRGPHLFPVEPRAGPDCHLQQVLENLWWQLDARTAHAPWEDKVVLTEVAGRVGVALAAWRRPNSDVDL